MDQVLPCLTSPKGHASHMLSQELWPTQDDVFQTNLVGVIDVGDREREPAMLNLYLKGMRHAEHTVFRGFLFLESAEHDWYNWGGTGLCMPQVALEWLPRGVPQVAMCPPTCVRPAENTD